MNEQPNYYAIIPAEVRYDNELRANEKLLYGEITALTYKTGECWASNSYFANLYGVSDSAIPKWIKDLADRNYINVSYVKNGNQIIKRIITINTHKCEEVLTKEEEGYSQMCKENNTSNNNITSIKKEIYKERKFTKPSLQEIEEYCRERNNSIDPQRFFDYYETNGWVQGKNKPIKDWRACIRTWEKRTVVNTTIKPDWFDKEQDIHILSKQEEQEMESLLNGYC